MSRIHHNQSESTLPDLKFGFVVFNNNKYNSEIQMYTSEQKMWHTDAKWGSRTFQRYASNLFQDLFLKEKN